MEFLQLHSADLLRTFSTPAPPPRFPALFRLVKLWARTHECNDASQSTLNSTALMYMCVFFLQRLGVLPPLRALCPPELAALPVARPDGYSDYEDVRLLDPRLRDLWVDEATLDRLISDVDGRAAEVNRRKRGALEGGPPPPPGDAHTPAALAAIGHDLTQLLVGFLCYWELPFGAWAEGRHRCAVGQF